MLAPLDMPKLVDTAPSVAARRARGLHSGVVLPTVEEPSRTLRHATEERAERSQRLDQIRPKLPGLTVRVWINGGRDLAALVRQAGQRPARPDVSLVASPFSTRAGPGLRSQPQGIMETESVQ